MDNLIFSLNATLPIFFTMLLGSFFKRVGLIDEAFSAKMNKFAFAVALPALLFQDISAVDIRESWNGGFVLFCFIATFLSITGVTVLSFFVVKREERGEFVQGAYRSSAAILGMAFIQSMYSSTGMAPLMIVAAVPLFNIFSVIVLTFKAVPENSDGKAAEKDSASNIKKACINIARNPIIIGIVLGFLASVAGLKQPVIMQKTIQSVAQTATPVALICIGAGFEGSKAIKKIKPTLIATFIKLVGIAAIAIPVAVMMGFRNQELVAILIMTASPSTVTCYIMAKNMDNDGVLSSSIIVLTTLLSSITLTGWIFVLRSLGLI